MYTKQETDKKTYQIFSHAIYVPTFEPKRQVTIYPKFTFGYLTHSIAEVIAKSNRQYLEKNVIQICFQDRGLATQLKELLMELEGKSNKEKKIYCDLTSDQFIVKMSYDNYVSVCGEKAFNKLLSMRQEGRDLVKEKEENKGVVVSFTNSRFGYFNQPFPVEKFIEEKDMIISKVIAGALEQRIENDIIYIVFNDRDEDKKLACQFRELITALVGNRNGEPKKIFWDERLGQFTIKLLSKEYADVFGKEILADLQASNEKEKDEDARDEFHYLA